MSTEISVYEKSLFEYDETIGNTVWASSLRHTATTTHRKTQMFCKIFVDRYQFLHMNQKWNQLLIFLFVFKCIFRSACVVYLSIMYELNVCALCIIMCICRNALAYIIAYINARQC